MRLRTDIKDKVKSCAKKFKLRAEKLAANSSDLSHEALDIYLRLSKDKSYKARLTKLSPITENKNRYANIMTLDDNRVVLNSFSSTNQQDKNTFQPSGGMFVESDTSDVKSCDPADVVFEEVKPVSEASVVLQRNPEPHVVEKEQSIEKNAEPIHQRVGSPQPVVGEELLSMQLKGNVDQEQMHKILGDKMLSDSKLKAAELDEGSEPVLASDYINASYVLDRPLLAEAPHYLITHAALSEKEKTEKLQIDYINDPEEFNKLVWDPSIKKQYMAYLKQHAKYIATQGPLKHTIFDFWEMVWQRNVRVILMVTKFVEADFVKVDKYFPTQDPSTASEEEVIKEVYFDERNSENPVVPYHYSVIVKELSQTKVKDCIYRTITLRKVLHKEHPVSYERDLSHFQHRGWPDFADISSVHEVVNLLEMVNHEVEVYDKQRQKQLQESSAFHPIVVHCSAGVGRTGTFLALDVMMKTYTRLKEGLVQENKKTLNDILSHYLLDVQQTVLDLRLQRPNMVITLDQYFMIYRVLYHWLFKVELSSGKSELPTRSHN